MPESDLTKLRRARTRAYMRLRTLEELVQAAHIRVAASEAAIRELAPDLFMVPARKAPPRRFRKSEIVWAALSILREAQAPLSAREIGLRVLAVKGIQIEPEALESTLYGVRKLFWWLGRRGITRKVGQGKATRHALVADQETARKP